MIGDYSCSSIAAWGAATKDGHLYQTRNLDWDMHLTAQDHPCIVIYIPDQGIPHANITFAGCIGSNTGINAQGIVLSEMGDSPGREYPYDINGVHFTTLFRTVLYDADSLDKAIDLFKSAERIKKYHFVVGDGQHRKAVKMLAHAPRLVIWNDNDPTDELAPHVLKNVVYQDEGRGAFRPLQDAVRQDRCARPDQRRLQDPDQRGQRARRRLRRHGARILGRVREEGHRGLQTALRARPVKGLSPLRGTRHRTRPAVRPLRQSMRVASIGARPVSPRRVLRMEAHFTVLSGPFRGQTFPIPRGKFILGREHDCHLVLDTNSVSRHHCVLLMDDFTLRIRDLASKNGTFINRDLTRVGERILAHGDRVRLGDLVIRVELESSAASPSAASLETQDVEPETIDHAGHSPEKHQGRSADIG